MLEQNQFILDNFDQIVAGMSIENLQAILIESIDNSSTKFSIESSIKRVEITEFEKYGRAYLSAPYGGKYSIIDAIKVLGIEPNSHQYWSLIIKQLLYDGFSGKRPCSGSFNKIAVVARELNLFRTKPYVDIQNIDQLISFRDTLEADADAALEVEINTKVAGMESALSVLCDWTIAEFKKFIPECGFMEFQRNIEVNYRFNDESYLQDCATSGKRLRQLSDYKFNKSARLIYPITETVSLRLYPTIEDKPNFSFLGVDHQDGIVVMIAKNEGHMNGNDFYFEADSVYTKFDNHIKLQLIDAIKLAKSGEEPIEKEEF